ncbi:hypothetical protein GCM10023107_88900 [Actinoplanes octamycinicus]|nr:hypothetical protein Aoc01nite_64310 [Actinoplanes octamycinicus]
MPAVAITTSILLLVGCASDDSAHTDGDIASLPAATVLEKSLAALKAVPSYKVEIHTNSTSGQASTTLAVVGTDLRGSVTRAGATSEVLKVGTNRYIRPDEAFWSTMLDKPKQAHAYTVAAHGRWIKVRADDDLLETGGLEGAFTFAARNALDSAVPQQASLGERKDVGGVPTITVLDSRNDRTQISVATTGEPYPVRWDFGLGAVATFTDFGAPADTIEEPAPTDVVDISTVLGSAK